MDKIFSAKKRVKYNKLQLFEYTFWLTSMFKIACILVVLMFENLPEKNSCKSQNTLWSVENDTTTSFRFFLRYICGSPSWVIHGISTK